MRYYIVTGETSGDLIGSIIADQIFKLDALAKISAWGSMHLKLAGAKIDQDIDSLNSMGFTEILKQIRHYKYLLQLLKSQLTHYSPDVLILIDFGEFNLRVGEWAHKKGIKTIYISPPKTWASRSYRNKKLIKFFDKLIVLFPFEKTYFDQKGIQTDYFGHPLFSNVNDNIKTHSLKRKDIIALVPGSRIQEVKGILRSMLNGLNNHREYKCIISCAPNVNHEVIKEIIKPYTHLDLSISNEPLEKILSESKYALVTSGTATLEACKVYVPQIVCYRTSTISYIIAKLLLTSNYISLPNLMLNKSVVTELIQGELSPSNISKELDRLCTPLVEEKILSNYQQINAQLCMDNCAENIAKTIIATI